MFVFILFKHKNQLGWSIITTSGGNICLNIALGAKVVLVISEDTNCNDYVLTRWPPYRIDFIQFKQNNQLGGGNKN